VPLYTYTCYSLCTVSLSLLGSMENVLHSLKRAQPPPLLWSLCRTLHPFWTVKLLSLCHICAEPRSLTRSPARLGSFTAGTGWVFFSRIVHHCISSSLS
jgi:hypothetical protein